MNRSVWSRAAVGAAAAVMLMTSSVGVRAEDESEADTLSLKIAKALRTDRFFVRAGGISVNVKTKSEDAYDVTGPAVTLEDVNNLLPAAGQTRAQYFAANPSVATHFITTPTVNALQLYNLMTNANGLVILRNKMVEQGISSIGTPPGIKAEAASSMSTGGISLGYYLGDDHDWVVETYVLAAPLSTSAKAATGIVTRGTEETDEEGNVITVDRPLLINGQKIVTTKILPPTVILGRYWGDKNARLRVFTGGLATYAIFMDTKATDYLNTYQGGANPGDTTVSMKNAFGVGPVFGAKYQLNDTWHLSLNVGMVKLKTEATIATKSAFTDATPALQDFGNEISDTIATGASSVAANSAAQLNGGLSGLVTRAIAGYKGEDYPKTFVRKSKLELTNTLFMFSVGRQF